VPVDDHEPDDGADCVCPLCNGDQDFDEYLSSVAAKIADHGWTVIGIMAEGNQPGWMYTVGLEQTVSHPELIITGVGTALNEKVAYFILSHLAGEIVTGRRLVPGEPVAQCLEGGYELMPVDVYDPYEGDTFNIAKHLYRGEDFAVLQLVWPDMDHRYPWDPDWEQGYHQCLIGERP
jgi:hypothetical protein